MEGIEEKKKKSKNEFVKIHIQHKIIDQCKIIKSYTNYNLNPTLNLA